MSSTLTIDKAGRIVLPKTFRDKLHLGAGDELEVQLQGDSITLNPVRREPNLRKELGIWVYYGHSDEFPSIPELVDADRERRALECLGVDSKS